jgi:hypothetical protein
MADYVCVVEGRVYYSNAGDLGKLYTVKTDGSDRQKLGDDRVASVWAEGDRLYCGVINTFSESGIYSIKTDGTDRRRAD